MKKQNQQKISISRVLLSLTLSSGTVSSVLYFLSMDRYPKSDQGQVLETIALWFSVLFLMLMICYILSVTVKKH